MTKNQALYEVYLIINELPEEEYNLIPQEEIDYIKDNMEEIENYSFDPTQDLATQNISSQAYDYLEKLLKKIEENNETTEESQVDELTYLRDLVEKLKKENEVIPASQKLIEKYENVVKAKNAEISNLKEQNEMLTSQINGLPKLVKKLFIKDASKLLKE